MSSVIHNGFLLTRQAHDVANKLQITLWVKSNTGINRLTITDQQAMFFIESCDVKQAKRLLSQQGIELSHCKALTLKTFNQVPVHAMYFSSLRSFYLARDVIKKNHIKCYEDDIRPDDRYLMERFITSHINFIGQKHDHGGFHDFSQVQCKKSADNQDIKLRLLSVDIECAMDGGLYSIGLYNLNRDSVADKSLAYKKVFMIGAPQEEAKPYIVWVANEQELLHAFIGEVIAKDPDIFIGWNVINFDFKLLQERCDKYNINFSLGRDAQSPRWRKNMSNPDQHFIEIAGRVVLDGIDLLRTATYSFPSFSLDNVASQLLGLQKQVGDVDNRIAEINHNFQHNKQALAAYNLEDCRLVSLIFEKEDLLAFAMLRAQLTGLPLDRVGGSVAAFTNLYLPKLHRSGYIAPNLGELDSSLVSPGGYVMDSTPGLYDNVLVLDFKSLYPSIIRTFKIDPMGLIEGLNEQKHILKNETSENYIGPIEAFDGAVFSREKHFLPDIITELWQERDKAKQQNNAPLSQAIKIIMNSFYGVLGSTGCRFFDPRLSGAITKRGHELLKITKEWIEALGYSVIYGDTDSIFVYIGKDKTKNESEVLGAELEQYINRCWQQEIEKKYATPCHLEIEFETHFSKFLMPTVRGSDIGTKKRYAGLVSTGATTELVFKGLESVRTDWTQLAKDFQRTLYWKVFNQEDITDFVLTTVAKTLAGEFDHKLVYRKRLRRQLSSYVKNVPPHVKAARLADEYNKKHQKPLKYQRRGWIEYYITLNGPQVKEQLTSTLDYQFYIDRQLAAVADAILPFIGTSFADITDQQLALF